MICIILDDTFSGEKTFVAFKRMPYRTKSCSQVHVHIRTMVRAELATPLDAMQVYAEFLSTQWIFSLATLAVAGCIAGVHVNRSQAVSTAQDEFGKLPFCACDRIVALCVLWSF